MTDDLRTPDEMRAGASDLAAAVSRAVCDPGSLVPRAGCCSQCGETAARWQARAALEAIRQWLLDKPAPVTAAELLAWLHGEAERYRVTALADTDPAAPVVLLEGVRANQKALADSLTAVIAHVAVMRPEIPHA